jgi:peptidyl-prolyl cis-trans isomerase SurA
MYKIFLFFFFFSFSFSQNEKDVLFTVSESPVYVDEFHRVYNKNIDLIKDSDHRDVQTYLDLFINYKLKLAEAYSLDLHKENTYLKELNKYAKQLQNSYLTDKETEEKFLKEAYERTKYEVKVSHVLIRHSEPEKDSIKVIEKLKNFRNDFLKLNIDNFNKKHNKNNKYIVEDLGYFSAFKMIYNFENIAYDTQIGEVSLPFKTRFGYHIIRVHDKRPSLGEINVGHIMIYKSKENSVEKINSILDSINKGSSFEYLAKKYSEDKNSAFKGGRMNSFSSGQINSIPFENAAFSLKNAGDISKVIETKYGLHIIKLYSKKNVKTFEEIKNQLLNKLKKSSRFDFISNSFYKSLLTKYNLTYENKNLKYFDSIVDDSFLGANWKIPEGIGNTSEMVSILNKTYSLLDFADYLENNQSKSPKKSLYNVLREKYRSFLNSKMLKIYKDNLENENSDYRNVLNEYREGLLLFNLMQDKIWTYNESDSLKLRDFFNKNSNSYESFESDKGKIIGDYQEKLELEWIKELKLKYPVLINKKALRRIKKMYPHE